jgi:homocysteine S-methyltransferase
VVTRLNHGIDIGGQPIGHPTSFHIGVAVNPTALDLDLEVRRLEYKIEAGAEFAVTQVVFDLGAFDTLMTRIEGLGIPIVVGVWPLENLRQAEFLANEVPGVRVPGDVLRRMRGAENPEQAAAEGVDIARALIQAVSGRVQGIQISAPSGKIDAVLALMAEVR